MNDGKPHTQGLEFLQDKLGYRFRDPDLLRLALSHSSMRQEGLQSNERLEFLGDAVLELLISTYLYDAFPGCDEGQLSIKRSRAVSRTALARVAEEIDLESHLIVAKGVRVEGRIPEALVGNAMEALVGAVYLDGGLDHTRLFVVRHFHRFVSKGDGESNPKSRLQTLAQKKEKLTPRYRTLEEEGPDHAKVFTVRVELGRRVLAEARGKTRKKAEYEAARQALARYAGEDDEQPA